MLSSSELDAPPEKSGGVVSRSQAAIFAQTPPSQKTSFAKAGSEQRWRSGYARLVEERVEVM